MASRTLKNRVIKVMRDLDITSEESAVERTQVDLAVLVARHYVEYVTDEIQRRYQVALNELIDEGVVLMTELEGYCYLRVTN